MTMQIAAPLLLICVFSRKSSGIPTAMPMLKHMSWRLVKFSITLNLTAFMSLGTGTYAMSLPPEMSIDTAEVK